MIKVFNSDDKTYETNGNVVLNPTYANIHKEDNGDYYLDLETSIEEDKIKHIEHEEGTTIETTGTTLTDVDTTKEHKFLSLYGETQQDSTTGKNLAKVVYGFTETKNSVTCKVNADGSVTLTGTASAVTTIVLSTGLGYASGTYAISVYGLPIDSDRVRVRFRNANGSYSEGDTNKTAELLYNRTTRTFTGRDVNNVEIFIFNGKATNCTLKIQLETGSTITSWEPYTNGASPNPTYPQPINVVSGDNTIKVCGKNLFDGEVEQGAIGGSVGNTYEQCKVSSTTRIRTTNLIALNTSETYTISIKNTFEYAVQAFNSEGKLYDSGVSGFGVYRSASISFTNIPYIALAVRKPNNDNITPSEINNVEVQIEKNNEATTYEAYTGNSQLISLGVENLVNNRLSSGTYNGITYVVNEDKSVTLSGSATAITWLILNSSITLEAGTYTMSSGNTSNTIRMYCGALGGYTSNGVRTKTLTSSQTSDISINIPNGTVIDTPITIYPMVEKGSKKNSYTPYGASYIELNKISTYQDYIYKDNDRWYLHKEIGKVVLDGSETGWTAYNQLGGIYAYYKKINGSKTDYTNAYNVYNYFTWASGNSALNSGEASIGGATRSKNGNFLFCVGDTTDKLNDFKTWLSTHNTIVYYVLATPTDTEITDTTLIEQLNNFEKMKLYNGITNTSITPNDLTPILKLHYNYIDGGDVIINNNDYIKSNNIIVANTPTGEQAFRITDIEKRKHKIVLKAWHISYDTKNYVIQDSYVVDKTCNQAMDHLNNATDNTSPFTTTSDITTINSYRCVRKSLFEASNVVLERWGGHFVRDNWNFKIMNSIGQDNGVVVRYAKNLKDIQVTYDWTNVVTKILPVGNDGLLLDEVFLYADIQYDIPYTKVVHFDQNINEDAYRDEQGVLDEDAYLEALKNDLRSQATLYLQENYLPLVNYSLNANLEKITDIGDTIQVKDERLGVDITTNLISYDYDCILEKYTNLEFGNFTKTISDLTSYINSQTSQIVDESISTTRITLENELETATSQIWGVLGSSYVLNEGDKILIVDSLPKETATNVIMINSAGIGFSQTGINGTFSTALTIDGTFNTSNVNVINFTADLIKGGVLKLGSNLNQNGILEVYDEANNLIAVLNKDGLRMNAVNGAYVLINQQVGFAGYDKNDNPIYWVSEDEFHMKKSVVEEEITLVDKMRIIPITITDNGTITNDGIGFVSTL